MLASCIPNLGAGFLFVLFCIEVISIAYDVIKRTDNEKKWVLSESHKERKKENKEEQHRKNKTPEQQHRGKR